jgi:glycosyltransferase involved in cell wall biosynthesis
MFNIDLSFLIIRTCTLITENDFAYAIPKEGIFFQLGNSFPIMVDCKARFFHHQIIYSTSEHTQNHPRISLKEVHDRFDSQHLTFFPSKYIQNFMVKTWSLRKSKCAIIYPPVSSIFTDQEISSSSRQGIISVGRFHPIKKQLYQIELFKKIHDEIQGDNKLTLIGSCKTPLSEELEKKSIGYPIEFKYSLNQNELLYEYLQAKIIWSTTGLNTGNDSNSYDVESFGLSLAEAASCGCIPVAIAAGGVTEIIHGMGNRKNGILVNNLNDLGIATKSLLSSEHELLILSENAAKNTIKFTMKAFEYSVIKKIVHIINKVM